MSAKEYKKNDLSAVKKHAKKLEGMRLEEVNLEIKKIDNISRVKSKSGVGDLVEYYFGVKKNSEAGPDLKDLKIEVKSCALRRRKNGSLSVKEPVSLGIINYMEEATAKKFTDSSLYKKNNSCLLVYFIHDDKVKRSKYKIHRVFLWKMDDNVINELISEYQKINRAIKNGLYCTTRNGKIIRAVTQGSVVKTGFCGGGVDGCNTNLHQTGAGKLTTCPKHSGDKFIITVDKVDVSLDILKNLIESEGRKIIQDKKGKIVGYMTPQRRTYVDYRAMLKKIEREEEEDDTINVKTNEKWHDFEEVKKEVAKLLKDGGVVVKNSKVKDHHRANQSLQILNEKYGKAERRSWRLTNRYILEILKQNS